MKSATVLTAVFAAAMSACAGLAAARALPFAPPDAARLTDGSLTRAFEKYYDAQFPVRRLGINTWAAIAYLLFREGRPGVVIGREDWLYTSEEFSAGPQAEAQVEQHMRTILQIRRELARRGTALEVAVVPAKARVYPETLGERHPEPMHEQLYARTLQALHAHDVAAPDLLAALSACKARGPVFLRTDTHWTPDGARCAARRLATEARASLRLHHPVRYRTSVEAVEPHRGDLLTFLPLDPYFRSLLPAPDELEIQRTDPVRAQAGLLDESPRPEVVLVGTSYSANPRWNFTGALQESFNADIVSYANEAQGPFAPMRQYLDSADFREAPPRLVIWEVPERYLPMPDGETTPTERTT